MSERLISRRTATKHKIARPALSACKETMGMGHGGERNMKGMFLKQQQEQQQSEFVQQKDTRFAKRELKLQCKSMDDDGSCTT